MTSSNEQRPGSGSSSRATVGNPGIRQFISRLDALKARVTYARENPPSHWSYPTEDIERLVAVVNVAHLRRNTRWAPDKTFEGEWVVIPREDFLALEDALTYWLASDER